MIAYGRGLENNTIEVLARLTSRDGTGALVTSTGEGNWLKQADFSGSTVGYTVKNLTTSTTVTTSTANITSVILDTPQTNWTGDDPGDVIGYNFRHVISGANFVDGGCVYAIEYTATLSSTNPLRWAVQYTTDQLETE